jgi:tRNA 2-selenouridine synthase
VRVTAAHHSREWQQKRNRNKRNRNPVREPAKVTVAHLSSFDEVIDARSEAEFAEDHFPGAINCPVLDNEQRARVGTIYKQQSPFEARKIGAALASANIARHIETNFLGRQREWRPLVYCWRGGERSAAFAHVLSRVGWEVGRLEGGYRNYRRTVLAELEHLPQEFRLRVICGLTGTGKSLLLRALGQAGAQTLDLEDLAAHRGSVLGNLPGEPQPSQKMFESRIWKALTGFDASRPVYVEAESRRIGALRVPSALVDRMWASECIVLESPVATRVAILKREYDHYFEQVEDLNGKLDCLAPLHGREQVDRWKTLALAANWDELVAELLARHYDPAYTRAIVSHYPALDEAPRLALTETGDAAFEQLAGRCLALDTPRERMEA